MWLAVRKHVNMVIIKIPICAVGTWYGTAMYGSLAQHSTDSDLFSTSVLESQLTTSTTFIHFINNNNNMEEANGR
ncbi:hypothetical protein WN944_025220 [Citrus x changshan-huyou]|uniref:Uncharacterized protein n=1 Tax=Citrus x changshan-huyou TaxID=2935761 RepID=A0AAP0LPD8_9ROSI